MRLASRAVLLNLTLCEVPCSGLHPVGGICVGRRASRKRNQAPSFSPPRFPRIDLAILNASAHLLRNIGLRRRETSGRDRKSTRLNSSHRCISYAVFCLKKKTKAETQKNWHLHARL